MRRIVHLLTAMGVFLLLAPVLGPLVYDAVQHWLEVEPPYSVAGTRFFCGLAGGVVVVVWIGLPVWLFSHLRSEYGDDGYGNLRGDEGRGG